MAWSPDGKTIVSGGAAGTIRLWDISGKLMGQGFKGHQGDVLSIRFSPDGITIVSSGKDGTIRLWDTNGKPVGQPFKGHQGGIRSLTLSPDGKTIVSGGSDKTVRLWTRQGQPIGQPWTGHEEEVASVALSPMVKPLPVAAMTGGFVCGTPRGNQSLNPSEGMRVRPLGHSHLVPRVEPSSVGGWMEPFLFGICGGNPLLGHPLIGYVGAVSSVALSPDAKTIFSSDDKGTIRLWDRHGYLIGQPFTGHDFGVYSGALSPRWQNHCQW